MCTVYGAMSNINHAKMSPGMAKDRFAHARKHLESATKLFQLQVQAGRYGLHGHPSSASSWEEECIKSVLKLEGVETVVGDQRRYG